MCICCVDPVTGMIMLVLVCTAIGIGVHMGNRHLKP